MAQRSSLKAIPVFVAHKAAILLPCAMVVIKTDSTYKMLKSCPVCGPPIFFLSLSLITQVSSFNTLAKDKWTQVFSHNILSLCIFVLMSSQYIFSTGFTTTIVYFWLLLLNMVAMELKGKIFESLVDVCKSFVSRYRSYSEIVRTSCHCIMFVWQHDWHMIYSVANAKY